MAAFIIWCIISLLFIGIGISCLFSKKATGFWANAKAPEVTDIKKYNKAMCILWCVFGGVMILLGIPLLAGQNSPYVFISVIGMFVEIICIMIVYVFIIEKKYRNKNN